MQLQHLAIILVLVTVPAQAQVGEPRRPAPEQAQPTCAYLDQNPESCSRVLACIGDDGLWFDGEARGWGQGTVRGRISDGTICQGSWGYEEGSNAARSRLLCDDGVEIGVIYTQQDPATGTGIGSGVDSEGRAILAWTGAHLLRFLTPDGEVGARLQCGDAPTIPIS